MGGSELLIRTGVGGSTEAYANLGKGFTEKFSLKDIDQIAIQLGKKFKPKQMDQVANFAIARYQELIQNYYYGKKDEREKILRLIEKVDVQGGTGEQATQMRDYLRTKLLTAIDRAETGYVYRPTKREKIKKALKIIGKAAAYTAVCIVANAFIPGLGVAVAAAGTAIGAIQAHTNSIAAENVEIGSWNPGTQTGTGYMADYENARIVMETNEQWKQMYSQLVSQGGTIPDGSGLGQLIINGTNAYNTAQTTADTALHNTYDSTYNIDQARQAIQVQNDRLWGTDGRFWEGAVWQTGMGILSIGLSVYAGYKLTKGVVGYVKGRKAKKNLQEVVDFVRKAPAATTDYAPMEIQPLFQAPKVPITH